MSPWKIERLATDGGRIAYVSCGHIFVWTPAQQNVRQAEPAASLQPFCDHPGDSGVFERFQIYDLALAGERVAFATRSGNMTQQFTLYTETLPPPPTPQVAVLAGGYAGCGAGTGCLGEIMGSGDLLVFSRWHEVDLQPSCSVRTTSQEIDRLDPSGCPCRQSRRHRGRSCRPTSTREGPWRSATTRRCSWTHRRRRPVGPGRRRLGSAHCDGSRCRPMWCAPRLRPAERSGALVHSWPLPNVFSAGPCGSPHPWTCTAALTLLDAARGFAAYVLGGEVHVIRLGDGHDTAVGPGTTARFFTGGLAYADGPRIQVLPFDRLAAR